MIQIRILLFSSLTFKTPTKNFLKKFSAFYFLKVHLHHFSKIKKSKRSHKIKVFLIRYFCLLIEGSGSIPLTNRSRSGSRTPKNMWIWWIRIRNTAFTFLHFTTVHFGSSSVAGPGPGAFLPLNTLTRKGKDPDPYLWLTDPDPRSPKT